MENIFKKVRFIIGDNDKYDYYILAKKEEIEFDKKSLSYKFGNEEKISVIYHNGIVGNFDFLLEKRTKNGEYRGQELAFENEIEFGL